jgi:hypothetical protein
MHHSTYFGANIAREEFSPYGLPWSTYADDRFMFADTLQGIRRLIRENR